MINIAKENRLKITSNYKWCSTIKKLHSAKLTYTPITYYELNQSFKYHWSSIDSKSYVKLTCAAKCREYLIKKVLKTS